VAARIRVQDFGPFPDEQIVTFTPEGKKSNRLNIHPWKRGNPAVYVALGRMSQKGYQRKTQ